MNPVQIVCCSERTTAKSDAFLDAHGVDHCYQVASHRRHHASNQTWDRDGLPAWSYRSSSMFELEQNRVFLSHWHVVGHVNDLREPGDWLSFDLLGDERAMVVCGKDGQVRAFHNT